ncbi:morphogenic membrane protein MmpB [Streptomyces sp. 8N706]
MLWSDPSDEPSKELRDAEAMLRRAGWVLAVAMVVLMLVLGLLTPRL